MYPYSRVFFAVGTVMKCYVKIMTGTFPKFGDVLFSDLAKHVHLTEKLFAVHGEQHVNHSVSLPTTVAIFPAPYVPSTPLAFPRLTFVTYAQKTYS